MNIDIETVNSQVYYFEGRLCKIIAYEEMGSVYVEFLDNSQCEIVSKKVLRRQNA